MLILLVAVVVSQQAPKPTAEQALFRDWARQVREVHEAADKRRPAERKAWLLKNWKAKEDKLRAKAKMSPQQLYSVLKQGLILHWSTASEADLKFAQGLLDPMILRDEQGDWATKNAPPPRRLPSGSSAKDFVNLVQDGSLDMADRMKRAPVVKCPAKDDAGRICDRKTVGDAGTKCYEHRR